MFTPSRTSRHAFISAEQTDSLAVQEGSVKSASADGFHASELRPDSVWCCAMDQERTTLSLSYGPSHRCFISFAGGVSISGAPTETARHFETLMLQTRLSRYSAMGTPGRGFTRRISAMSWLAHHVYQLSGSLMSAGYINAVGLQLAVHK